MKPASFDFFAPDSLEGALDALEQHGYDAKILAGGQSLIPAMNFRVMQPAVLVDLNHISSLSYIQTTESQGLRIGAMTRQRDVERSDLVENHAPLLHETMPNIAHLQIRNRGTIGGSLAHADPSAELPVVALTLNARMKIQSKVETRWVEAADFFQFMFMTDLQPNEILTEIEFPAMQENTGWGFEEFARRKGDYALAGVAALLSTDENGICTDARLIYLSLGDGPITASKAQDILIGEKPGTDVFQAAAASAAQEVEPPGNVHASIEYQRHLASVLTERVLKRAAGRLNGSNGHV